MTDEALTVDFEALEKATADTSEQGEAYFSRAARSWVPLLLAEVRRLRALCDELRANGGRAADEE